MRISALILIGMAATLLQSSASSQDTVHVPRKEIDESAKKVSELQKERIATLKKVVDIGFQLAKGNRLEIREVAEARLILLKAELEVAEKESERISLYRIASESLKEFEALAEAKRNAGRGTELDILAIKAKRLEIEIHLEQTNMKEVK